MTEWKIWEIRREPPDFWPHSWVATPLDGTASEREDFFDTREEAVEYAAAQNRRDIRRHLLKTVRKWVGKR